MADNVTLPAIGSGDSTPVISTEEVSTLNGAGVTAQQVQRAAIVTIPSNGVADDVDAGNPLHVTAVVTTMPSNSSVNIAQVAGATVATGHGTASGAQRVELPTDGTGVIAGVTTVGTVSTVTAVTSVTNPVTVVQATATSLKAQAEVFQGGTAVSAAAPLQVSLANTATNATAVKVDGTGGSFPISGTAAVTQSTSPWIVAGGGTAGTAATGVVTVQGIASGTVLPVSAASLPLPSGASTLAEQQTQTTSLQLLDDAVATTASAITAKGFAASGTDGTNARILKTDTSGELQIDVLTLPANASVNLAQVGGGTVTTGHGTASGAQRVELPTDGTGVIAGVTTVTTVTNVATIGTSVTPGTGASNLGKAEDSGHTSADVGVFALAVRQDSPDTAVTNTTADYSQVSVSSTGALRNAPMSEDFAALANGPQVKKYYANTGAVTDGIVWSPASGKRWYVTDLVMTISAAATVTFEDDKAGGDEVVLAGDFAANSGLSSHFQTPLFSGEDAADLMVTTSAGNVKITITGYEI